MKHREVQMIDFDLIDFGQRARKEYDRIVDLKASIVQTKGLVQSLAVFPRLDGRFTLVSGGRRYVALKELFNEEKLKQAYPDKKVPCITVEEGVTSAELKLLELEENIQREDLTPYESAILLTEIHETLITINDESWSQRDTARHIGISHATISNAIAIIRSSEVIPEIKDSKTKREALLTMRQTADLIDRKAKMYKVEIGKTTVSQDKQKVISRFFVGDAIDWMKGLQSGTAEIVELDTPFAIGLKDIKKTKDSDEKDDYIEWSGTEYREFLPILLKESFRILKKDGWILVWFGMDPWFEKTFKMIKDAGFECKMMPAIWVKDRSQSNVPDIYLSNRYETFYYARKGGAKLQKPTSNTFIYPTVPSSRKPHITTKPIPLMQNIYRVFGTLGSSLVIPCCGSGWGILAAENERMKAIGCDKSSEMKEKFTVKVMEEDIGEYK